MIGGKDMVRSKMNMRRLAKDVGLDQGDNEPIPSIHYPISSDRRNRILGIGCWILDICTFANHLRRGYGGQDVEMLPVANANFQLDAHANYSCIMCQNMLL